MNSAGRMQGRRRTERRIETDERSSDERTIGPRQIEPARRRISDVDEVVALWAAHERGDVDVDDAIRVLPRGLENYRATLIGLTTRAQVHAWVSGLRGGYHFPGYRLAYPVLWWSCFRQGSFNAKLFLRINRREFSPSNEAAVLTIGYEGRNPDQVLNLFLGLIERSLEFDPLEIEPMTEAPCGIEIAEAIARQVSEEVDRRGDGVRTF